MPALRDFDELSLNSEFLSRALIAIAIPPPMAAASEVKQYLALWFQLGKGAVDNRSGEVFRVRQILKGDRYSSDFERCWERIVAEPAEFSLEGTTRSIAELLSNVWELTTCPRCVLPIPINLHGSEAGPCECVSLSWWPDNESPPPHLPVSDRTQLGFLCSRLNKPDLEQESSVVEAHPAEPAHPTPPKPETTSAIGRVVPHLSPCRMEKEFHKCRHYALEVNLTG